MQIKISKDFRLLSHKIGTSFLIKNTFYFVTIYSGLLLFKDLNTKKYFKIFLDFVGPAKNFTILQDLKNGSIRVFFQTLKGFLSYKILTDNFVSDTSLSDQLDQTKISKAYIHFENLPSDDLILRFNFDDKNENQKKVKAKDVFILPIEKIYDLNIDEILSFGIFKIPDLELIKKRENPTEIVPIIFILSQYYPDIKNSKEFSKNSLIEIFNKKIQMKEKTSLEDSFLNIYKALFFEAFIPRINDEDHQNILPFLEDQNISPIKVLNELYKSIKSLIISENKKDNLLELYFLPCLFIPFHAGKALNLKTSFGTIDLVFSKKLLKMAIIRPSINQKVKLILQSQIKNFRLRMSNKEKGKIFENEDEILFEKDSTYFLDNFKK